MKCEMLFPTGRDHQSQVVSSLLLNVAGILESHACNGEAVNTIRQFGKLIAKEGRMFDEARTLKDRLMSTHGDHDVYALRLEELVKCFDAIIEDALTFTINTYESHFINN